jgi:hypothetical protein
MSDSQQEQEEEEEKKQTVSILIPPDMLQWRQNIHHIMESVTSQRSIGSKREDHDIRYLLNNKNHEDVSWRYEEEELAQRGIYNWFQIRNALRGYTSEPCVYKTIEEANVFDDIPDVNDNEEENDARQVLPLSKSPHQIHRMKQSRAEQILLKRSIPRTIEYWRRMQHEIAENSGLPPYIRPYETPKLRLQHRIKQPDTSSFTTSIENKK